MTKTKGMVLALAIGLAACSGDDDDGGTSAKFQASCDDSALNGYCDEYFGSLSSADLGEVQADCTGTWSTSARCPGTGRDGTCTVELSELGYGAGSVKEYYYDLVTTDDVNLAKGLCTIVGGAWSN
jgi:hypothetical protein